MNNGKTLVKNLEVESKVLHPFRMFNVIFGGKLWSGLGEVERGGWSCRTGLHNSTCRRIRLDMDTR